MTTYILNVKTKQLIPSPFKRQVDDSALFLIPIPTPSGSAIQGLIVAGDNCVQYFDPSNPSKSSSLAFRPAPLKTWCMIDDRRFLVGDENGCLYILVLAITPANASKPPQLYFSPLGLVHYGQYNVDLFCRLVGQHVSRTSMTATFSLDQQQETHN